MRTSGCRDETRLVTSNLTARTYIFVFAFASTRGADEALGYTVNPKPVEDRSLLARL
jgi:hypothetical protein